MRAQEADLAGRPAGAATVFMDVDVAANRGIAVDDIRVGQFPCDQYNVTPSPSDTLDALAAHFFLHFKGNRKPMQARYLDGVRAMPARGG